MKLKKGQVIDIDWLCNIIYTITSIKYSEHYGLIQIAFDSKIDDIERHSLTTLKCFTEELQAFGLENIKIDGKKLEL